ncbi:hypothetical protein BV25DRAFT_1838024 [Artomyces pyxidatus]|uniref:Uncharacterized protein n=1 Tax=Artomyces pyxidatus TaxID=48021 RepID=A0ACB8T3F5_9AGAM|nr:hypothetical protein BV25DRAFT_1838024 [Artomyces pyxidatus]
MFSAVATFALLAGGIVSASAQSLSSGCQSTLAAVASSSDADCLNAAGLIPLALAGNNTSLVTPLNNWLTGLCSQTACTNSSLSAVVTNVTQGCSGDLASIGFNSDALPTVIADVQSFYPLVREVACLKDDSANELCVTEELNALQSAVGSLTINTITGLIPKVLAGGFSSLNLPNNATCNSCTKEAYNLINSQMPSIISSDDNSTISSSCGADFSNGAQPSGISQTAAGLSLSNGKNTNAAMSAFPMGSAVASLFALAAGFAALA